MGYTPKHAKPVSLSTNTAAHRRYPLTGYKGRHAAPASFARQGEGTAAHALRVS